MKKTLIIVLIILNIALLVAVVYIGGYRTDYFKRQHAKITHTPYVPVRTDRDCVLSWNNCIKKLDMQYDVVFFGDSHIAEGAFQNAFPNVKSINLGYIGEDTKGMLRRVEAITAVQPKKMFLMGGINGLYHQSLEEFEYWYAALVDSIRAAVPDAELYIHTLLPVTASSDYCDKAKIVEANTVITRLARDRNLTLIDLHSRYAIANALPNSMSQDGLHLTNDAYSIWYNEIKQYVE